jgi:hypothetical protein
MSIPIPFKQTNDYHKTIIVKMMTSNGADIKPRSTASNTRTTDEEKHLIKTYRWLGISQQTPVDLREPLVLLDFAGTAFTA